MPSFPVNKRQTVTFARLANIDVLRYNVYAHEDLPEGGNQKTLLVALENPREPQLREYTKELPYNLAQSFWLPGDVYTDIDNPVQVFVNGLKVEKVHLVYSQKLKLLQVLKSLPLRESDKIEVRYKKDVVSYIHNTDKRLRYTVEPVMASTHRIGTHNIIK